MMMIANIFELLCTRHCAKRSTCLISSNPHNNPMRSVLLFSPFFRWRSWGLELVWGHTARKWELRLDPPESDFRACALSSPPPSRDTQWIRGYQWAKEFLCSNYYVSVWNHWPTESQEASPPTSYSRVVPTHSIPGPPPGPRSQCIGTLRGELHISHLLLNVYLCLVWLLPDIWTWSCLILSNKDLHH